MRIMTKRLNKSVQTGSDNISDEIISSNGGIVVIASNTKDSFGFGFGFVYYEFLPDFTWSDLLNMIRSNSMYVSVAKVCAN